MASLWEELKTNLLTISIFIKKIGNGGNPERATRNSLKEEEFLIERE
jgi:hypothetical protein